LFFENSIRIIQAKIKNKHSTRCKSK